MKPKINSDDVSRLRYALRSGQWIKARDLVQIPGLNHRKIRAVCEQTGIAISGQKGYKLAMFASQRELREARNTLRSYARHIDARADRIDRMIAERSPQQEELLL